MAKSEIVFEVTSKSSAVVPEWRSIEATPESGITNRSSVHPRDDAGWDWISSGTQRAPS
jgi:hypothetical protein